MRGCQCGAAHPVSALCHVPCRFLGSKPLWMKVLSATALGMPLLLGIRYALAEPQDKRRLRLVVEGVGRFGRWEEPGLG